MIYLICFLFSIFTLLFLIKNGKGMDINVVITSVICVIGNGGYFALYMSRNLEEAILANKITYSVGCFVPMLMFILICKICRFDINTTVQTVLYIIQFVIFLSVCTSGFYDLFYKTIEYHEGSYGAYLSKTYGPMHDVYIAVFCAYIIGCIIVVGRSIRKRTCSVSTGKAYILLALFLISAILYFAERIAKITIELEPMIFTVTSFLVIVIFINISRYSAYGNLSILESNKKDEAYIVFNKKLNYMSCNDYAKELFPELKEWEIEKMIPGNGGRFNTFLRVPFMRFVNGEFEDEYVSGFEFIEKYYRVEINRLYNDRLKDIGYVIKVSLDVVKTRELSDNI